MIKIGIVCICLNPSYWPYISEMLWGLDTFFLKHPDIKDKYEIEFLVWSDIPEEPETIRQRMAEYLAQRGEARVSVINSKDVHILFDGNKANELENFIQNFSHKRKSIKIFPTEPIEWPMPTLMRYHLLLQQEEYLKKFDYIFYIDVDMRITDWIDEEILGNLVAAQHPMYALRQNYHPPYEPNPESSAYIPRPGRILEENGKKRFEPLYFAGGFQGGKTEDFIKAMKVMRGRVDEDFNRNYIAIWNDETHWNKYLFENPPAVVLSPAYIYPDSLIDTYYIRVWGRNYSPKIMTLTKAFSMTTKEGKAVNDLVATM